MEGRSPAICNFSSLHSLLCVVRIYECSGLLNLSFFLSLVSLCDVPEGHNLCFSSSGSTCCLVRRFLSPLVLMQSSDFLLPNCGQKYHSLMSESLQELWIRERTACLGRLMYSLVLPPTRLHFTPITDFTNANLWPAGWVPTSSKLPQFLCQRSDRRGGGSAGGGVVGGWQQSRSPAGRNRKCKEEEDLFYCN